MSNILERLKLERRREVVLNTGRKVGYHLPDLEECILKVGQIPMPALARMASGGEPSEEEAAKLIAEHPDAVEKGRQFTRLVVATMLDDIDGEAIDDDDDRPAIADMLTPSERQELFLLATRDDDSGEA